ncbi:Piso0_004293 [Millerozyma farinosa CBS 7064]|uniref:Piso0_004293 protein n=1 Tax=Pichia sorbitophila (strain ATCC MYA-4447 / BCRC 22081 / CBS 7064 / NBRC 10061 / NRRL Y-12695) TaxID=559304 RepID=G8YB43_PICSO|nr:Piso0_004293 [Millerozyma farinosa CBS 7064]CCE84738.1 Piso0_004293 [Millerozyma farinosa CBS 7064]
MLRCKVGLLRVPPTRIINGGMTMINIRMKSNLPENFDPKKDLPSSGEWKHLKQHIPGEGVQKDDLKSRLPKFPLAKETVPTLLPRPGVPQVGPKYSFRQVIQILKNKKAPELIYEAEPHKLYFLACFCCGTVFTIYGLVLLEYAWFQSNKDYEENVEELTEPLRTREWAVSLLKHSVFGVIALTAAYGAFMFPTRLIRRMWYLPGPVEHIKFTSYPLIPGRPTPVYTLPLNNIFRKHKARIWTGKGFYGTADNSLFFFTLKEAGEKGRNWIVDRKGFFWSDGRVFDLLFGKETVAEAEAGIPYDEQVGIVNREVEKKRKELRNKHGFFYKWKIQASEMKKDVSAASNYIKTIKENQSKKNQIDDGSSKK